MRQAMRGIGEVDVANNLRRFRRRRKGVKCRKCGYKGDMGITKTKPRWYVSWPVILWLCCTGIGVIAASILGFLRASSMNVWCCCPSCDKVIGPL